MRDEFDIATAIAYKENPYIGLFVWNCTLIRDERVKTAGVGIKNGRVAFMYNPVWFNNVFKEHDIHTADRFRVGIIKHEIFHLIEEHISRLEKLAHKHIANIAADCAINQSINEFKQYEGKMIPIGEDGIKPGMVLFPSKFYLPNEQTTEWYYERLLENAKVIKVNSPGSGEPYSGEETLDEHETWFDDDDLDPQIREAIYEEAVKQTYEQLKSKELGWGKMPAGYIDKIVEIANRIKIPWQQHLKKIVASASVPNITYSYERPNRMLAALGYGYKAHINPEPVISHGINITCIMDTSGSMSNELLAQIYEQIKYMHNLGHKITIIYADVDVQHIEVYSPFKPRRRHGRGGTSFVPACIQARKMNADFNIYFTDSAGDYPDLSEMPNPRKFVWCVTCENHMAPDGLGRIVKMVDPNPKKK